MDWASAVIISLVPWVCAADARHQSVGRARQIIARHQFPAAATFAAAFS
jgi:hypothetical protein